MYKGKLLTIYGNLFIVQKMHNEFSGRLLRLDNLEIINIFYFTDLSDC